MYNNKSFWDKFSPLYNLFRITSNKGYTQMIYEIKKDLNPSMKVLEIGTATGIISLAVHKHCKYIIATDFSEKMIAQAKKETVPRNVRFETADGTNLHYEKNSFDAVIISNVLHIVPEPEKILENISYVLKDDGLLICPTFTRNNTMKEQVPNFFLELLGLKTFSKWTNGDFIDFLTIHDFIVKRNKVIKAPFPISYTTAIKK